MSEKRCRIAKVPDNLVGGVFRHHGMAAIRLCFPVSSQSGAVADTSHYKVAAACFGGMNSVAKAGRHSVFEAPIASGFQPFSGLTPARVSACELFSPIISRDGFDRSGCEESAIAGAPLKVVFSSVGDEDGKRFLPMRFARQVHEPCPLLHIEPRTLVGDETPPGVLGLFAMETAYRWEKSVGSNASWSR